MRELIIQNTYVKDLKLVIKQNWDIESTEQVVHSLLCDEVLNKRLKDHPLTGELKGFRDCHVYGDLAIIYKRSKRELIL
ncbi:hypothetical protein BKH43_01850 [Helicobacter sp. 13S00401-1]|uniref:type II toxin-antitoxin system RelE/ParE family toxin n=1 Tax=Helicobacter sp. 13S00401-1 TaxID=1905758 RepID=UPI000BA692EA|nr:type II toxin-antitoxin system mRNA interferase toxin, RelE/StbE family [Helicobacter sp. 13S00401-1]PAF51409.1 hypothetical protein BKH43_01850 [Helicobacter sp. 13S00401-1]